MEVTRSGEEIVDHPDEPSARYGYITDRPDGKTAWELSGPDRAMNLDFINRPPLPLAEHCIDYGSFEKRRRPPKVPKFDGAGRFSDWYMKFCAIATTAGWNNVEKTVRLIAALEDDATDILDGLLEPQLVNFGELIARLKGRYDPPDRETIYRMEFSSRKRRRDESPDEFAENLQALAERGFPGHRFGDAATDPIAASMVDRFCSGQPDKTLANYLFCYPSREINELV